MSEKQEIYELIRDSGILCDDCGPHGSTYCAEALAELLTQNGYGKAVAVKPLKERGFRAWLRRVFQGLTPRKGVIYIDEMHEHRDHAIHDALKQGMSKRLDKEVLPFDAFLDKYFATGFPMKREDRDDFFKNECALALLKELRAAGAIAFTIVEDAASISTGVKRVRYRAHIDVVMPEKEAEQ